MSAAKGVFAGRRILVVEDDYFVAELVCELLEEKGLRVLGPAGFVGEALALLENDTEKLDWALLDVNLHGETSFRIADALQGRGIDFVFLTGYTGEMLPSRFRDRPRCSKPLTGGDILAALARLGADR